MLIEQIVEFQFYELYITSYFHDKTKISKENLRVGFHLLPKCCARQCTLLPLPGANHVQLNLNTKMQDVNRVLDLNCN